MADPNEYVPAAQVTIAAVVVGHACPAAHTVHEAAFAADRLPGRHWRGLNDGEGHSYPAGQAGHVPLLWPGSEYRFVPPHA